MEGKGSPLDMGNSGGRDSREEGGQTEGREGVYEGQMEDRGGEEEGWG